MFFERKAQKRMPPNRTINHMTQAVRAVSESDWRSMPISPKRMKAKITTVEKVNVYTKERCPYRT